MAKFAAVDIIAVKRDKGTLSQEQIQWMIDAYTKGEVADEQMSALAMAIYINGMNREEILHWTKAMIASGQRMNFSNIGRKTADKHSTGGVGDKITLPLAPLVASYGVAVPQISGRGLGHTGGTLDKMESIAGWQAQLSNDEVIQMLGLEGPGAVICAAGPGIAPADKKLYALRDVTSTVSCVPLIASSIMSKKIAEGTQTLVLDVKVGSGAFMKTQAQAKELATTMVALGKDAGVQTIALITDMSTPIGITVGNALEVRESIEVIAGGGPRDVVEITVALAREMLQASGVDVDPTENLNNGKAMDVWNDMIARQGGDLSVKLPTAKHTLDIKADKTGTVTKLDALGVGVCSWRLGAGRARKEDLVQAGAGVEIFAPQGSLVEAGDTILRLHTDEEKLFSFAQEALEGAIEIVDGAKAEEREIILEKII